MTQQIADNFTTMKEAPWRAARRASRPPTPTPEVVQRADRPRASSVSASPQLMTMLGDLHNRNNYAQAGLPLAPAAAPPAAAPPRRSATDTAPFRSVAGPALPGPLLRYLLRDVNLLPSDDERNLCNGAAARASRGARRRDRCGVRRRRRRRRRRPAAAAAADCRRLRRIADAFARRMAFFKLYSMYCSTSSSLPPPVLCCETPPVVQQLLTEVEGQYQTTALGLMIRPCSASASTSPLPRGVEAPAE